MRATPLEHLPRPVHGLIGRSGYLVGIILTGACAAFIVAGCGKKPLGQSIGSYIEDVFSRRPIAAKVPDEEPLREKGLRLAKERQFEQAAEAFMRLVEQEPEDFFGYNALAVCHKNRGDHAEAMKNFERALEFIEGKEDRAKVLANIGNLYFATGKPQTALDQYKEAAGEFKENPLYLVLIARTFLVLNEPARAQRVLATAEANVRGLDKYQPEDDKGLGYYLMSHCFAALGEEDKVLKYLERALKANPERFVPRLAKESADQQSLFYTLKDHPDFRKLVDKFAGSLSPGRWIDQD